MSNLTKCGYCCDLCKAYVPNIQKKDQRKELSEMWKQYYDLDITPEDIYCDGCRCEKIDAKLIDNKCPVRACVTTAKVCHCGECVKYPCPSFIQRKGLSAQEAQEKLKDNFDFPKYNEFLLAYDNKSRLDDYKNNIK